MAKRHWLDPLARQVLVASGQMQPRIRQHPTPEPPIPDGRLEAHEQEVEQELLALKLQQNPSRPLRTALEVKQAAALGWQLDVNRATAADWQRLPGLPPQQVDLLMRLQAGGVQLSGPDDLQRLLDVPEALLQSWLPVLAFRWYSEPSDAGQPLQRLDLNQANAIQLARLGLTPERVLRLQRERTRRPFSDLADLQRRCHFPPHQVEAWIGKVSFGFRTSPGPTLPPSTRQGCPP